MLGPLPGTTPKSTKIPIHKIKNCSSGTPPEVTSTASEIAPAAAAIFALIFVLAKIDQLRRRQAPAPTDSTRHPLCAARD